MTLAGLSAFLAAHGLALLLPLSIIEGPLVSLLAGVLCAQGVLAWQWVLPLLVLGDLLGDLLYYAIGRFSHGGLHRLAIRLRLPVQRGEAWADRVAAHATRMLLIGKWTHVIGALVLIAAGAARIGLARFLIINLLATVPKSALLLGAGAALGAHAGTILQQFGYVMPALLLAGALALWIVFRRRHATAEPPA